MNFKNVLAALILFAASIPVHAQPVTFDFKGTGEVCTQPAPGTTWTCRSGLEVSGTMTMELLADGPAGPDAGITVNSVCDLNGWVQSHFVVRWGDEVFEPAPFRDNRESRSEACVENNQWYLDASSPDFWDSMTNSEYYIGEPVPGMQCYESAALNRQTFDTSWLSDLSFDLFAGLAPGERGFSTIDVSHFCDAFAAGDFEGFDRTVFYGSFELTSLTPRPSVSTVAIDVKPRDELNTLNPRGKGIIPVAVLGSQEFDATQVDASSVRFAVGEATPLGDGHVADVNGDGFPDMLLHFRTQAADIDCGSRSASLSGQTFDGESFEGSDTIRTVGCERGRHPVCPHRTGSHDHHHRSSGGFTFRNARHSTRS